MSSSESPTASGWGHVAIQAPESTYCTKTPVYIPVKITNHFTVINQGSNVSNRIEQLSTVVQQLATSTQEMQGAMQQTNSTMQEMQVALRQTNSTMQEMQGAILQTNFTMREMQSTMHQMNLTMQNAHQYLLQRIEKLEHDLISSNAAVNLAAVDGWRMEKILDWYLGLSDFKKGVVLILVIFVAGCCISVAYWAIPHIARFVAGAGPGRSLFKSIQPIANQLIANKRLAKCAQQFVKVLIGSTTLQEFLSTSVVQDIKGANLGAALAAALLAALPISSRNSI